MSERLYHAIFMAHQKSSCAAHARKVVSGEVYTRPDSPIRAKAPVVAARLAQEAQQWWGKSMEMLTV